MGWREGAAYGMEGESGLWDGGRERPMEWREGAAYGMEGGSGLWDGGRERPMGWKSRPKKN